MKLLLFEGVATTGKSTIEQELMRRAESHGFSVSLYHEDETVIPLLGDKSVEAARTIQLQILDRIEADSHDLILVDRLYLTHLERTGAHPADFALIAERLRKLGAQIIFLFVTEDQFRPRLEDALARRAQKFADHVTRKGGSEAMVEKYIQEQRTLLDLLRSIDLPVHRYDTSNMDFQTVADQVLN